MSTAFDSTLSNLGINRTTTSATATTTKKTAGSLDQSDFLKLMTAQLKNQDPFNPVDNTQMIAQMAQMSSVSGIAQMNTTLSGIATKLGATSSADALAYVGKTILTEGSTAYPRTTGGIAGAVELAGDATDVSVSITDASGQVLRDIQLGKQSAGTVTYDWDGTNDAGEKVGTAPFTVAVSASNAGAKVKATGLVWAPVESVSLPSGGDPSLVVTGLGPVKPAAVRSVG